MDNTVQKNHKTDFIQGTKGRNSKSSKNSQIIIFCIDSLKMHFFQQLMISSAVPKDNIQLIKLGCIS